MFKDEILAKLSATANVAQFISYGPDLNQRYSRLLGLDDDTKFDSVLNAAKAILARSPEKSVNIRSFEPDSPKSREFIYGITDANLVTSHIIRLSAEGLYTIINETVDINDGGVSGVALGNLVEFAPGDTPRCVEKPGTLQLSRRWAGDFFDIVYGIDFILPYPETYRVEFSVHPLKRGHKNENIIVWEAEEIGETDLTPVVKWPNRFSEFIGDKAFGLLMAALIDPWNIERNWINIPKTTVISRNIAPFSFGIHTCCEDKWIRTCPCVQTPGKFSTFRGWRDPFKLMQDEDPGGDKIASILSMSGVNAKYSGALILQSDGTPLIEGKEGFGDTFMLGEEVGTIPQSVEKSVMRLCISLFEVFGSVRFEWVYDHSGNLWLVQLHCGTTTTLGNVIYPGEPTKWVDFQVSDGLVKLRELIESVRENHSFLGINVVGHVGVTSHIGDVLRKAKIPSKISGD